MSEYLEQVLREVRKSQQFQFNLQTLTIEISHILYKSLLMCGLKVLLFENCARYISAYLVTTVKRC